MHGFALNLHPDLAYFGMMNPCGIADRPVTTLSELIGRKVTLEATEALIPHFERVFEYQGSEAQFGAFSRGQARAGIRGGSAG